MPKKKSKRIHILKVLAIVLFVVIAILAGLVAQIVTQLPDVKTINTYVPSETTLLYSADEKILARLHKEENRQVVPLAKISPYLIKAIIATEDPKFYSHKGLDLGRIVKAAVKDVIYGRFKEGASTITQQLARNLFLTRRKAIIRKIAEAILALQIERYYTKNEILELYLNQVYLGHNSYGIESASNIYFGKSAAKLDLAESALLAGLVRGPELYSPYRNPKVARQRQLYVINKMLKDKVVTEREAKLAAIEELNFTRKNLKRYSPLGSYFIQYVLQDLIKKYGKNKVYHGGLKVYTTLQTSMQAQAEEIVSKFASREGQTYNFSQAALLSLDPRTGYIKAMVGGVDFYESQFNRAVQAQRSPGSAFKPFVYTAAMQQGLSPGTIIQDTLTTFEVYPNEWNPEGIWTPNNYDEKFRGPVTLRYALEKSLNIPAIKILERVGIRNVINLAHKMGIKSHLEPGLALTLGASEVNMLELTSAFGVFANSGIRVEPTAVTKITDRNGQIIFKHNIKETQVLDPNIVAAVIDLMKGVLKRGTGVRGQIGRPAAAKTGTAEEFRDAWFVGFVPQLVTAVWVGNDDNVSMKGVAEVAICPRIWKQFNKAVLQGQPILDWRKPEGLVDLEICRQSGKKVTPYCPQEDRLIAQFWQDRQPQEECDTHAFYQPKVISWEAEQDDSQIWY